MLTSPELHKIAKNWSFCRSKLGFRPLDDARLRGVDSAHYVDLLLLPVALIPVLPSGCVVITTSSEYRVKISPTVLDFASIGLRHSPNPTNSTDRTVDGAPSWSWASVTGAIAHARRKEWMLNLESSLRIVSVDYVVPAENTLLAALCERPSPCLGGLFTVPS
jgi:hypothetical protein